MVETISPTVHGGRTTKYWFAIGLHTLGAATASAAVGAAIGGLGAVTGAPWGFSGVLLVAGVALVYATRDLFSSAIPLPDLDRQVPEWWRTFFPLPLSSFLYGVGLGIAFYTSLSYGTFVVVAVAAFAAGDPQLGALVAAPFGLGRALVVSAGNPHDLADVNRQRLLGRVNGLASASLAASVLLLPLGLAG